MKAHATPAPCRNGCCGSAACGCCAGILAVTPESVANRPGLTALRYRVGTHTSFFETMLARLSSARHPALAGLKTRDRRDFTIALLDGWATLADILTFYQERIANEGFLRTATERRSVEELARLVGYRLRPGVASSVRLAFQMEKGHDVAIPAGARVQSQPGPDEQPQSFETSEPLEARYAWNELPVRTHRPQRITRDVALVMLHVFVKGTTTQLKKNDSLLFVFGDGPGQRVLRRVEAVTPDYDAGRTNVTLRRAPKAYAELVRVIEATLPNAQTAGEKLLVLLRNLVLGVSPVAFREQAGTAAIVLQDNPASLQVVLEPVIRELRRFAQGEDAPEPPDTKQPARLRLFLEKLLLTPRAQPRSTWTLPRALGTAFAPHGDALPQLLTGFHPPLAFTLYPALAAAQISAFGIPAPPDAPPELLLQSLHALRLSAPIFGYNARVRIVLDAHNKPVEVAIQTSPDESPERLFLDAAYDAVPADGYVVVRRAGAKFPLLSAHRTSDVEVRPRNAYDLSAKTTEITFAPNEPGWRGDVENMWPLLQSTKVWAQSELLDLADEPITADVTGGRLELQGLFGALRTGRWIAVTGERTDVPGTTSVTAAEVVMLAGVDVEQDATLPGDRPRTVLALAGEGLRYVYKRSTLKINANVAEATHGETVKETLGSGDGSRAFPSFLLKQSPLTYTSAPTASGAASSLEVRVNDLRWHEKESLLDAGPSGRAYVTRTDDEGKTTVVFGDGVTGARLPSGAENVKAVYRRGIGKPGNVGAGRITLLQTKPLGVDKVENPLPATGGADPEPRDAARANAPLSVMALDRLVSVQDYADFARTYAGIAKASARRLSDGRRELLHVTVAGLDDIPIAEDSALLANLAESLRRLGDPHLPVRVAVRQRMRLLVSAKIRVAEDHAFEFVAPAVRSALAQAFGFAWRDLGQPVFLSEVVSVMQAVRGVDWVDVDALDAWTSEDVLRLLEGERPGGAAASAPSVPLRVAIPVPLATLAADAVVPAHIAYLSLDVPDTLVLAESKP